jgi:hypothetical protein
VPKRIFGPKRGKYREKCIPRAFIIRNTREDERKDVHGVHFAYFILKNAQKCCNENYGKPLQVPYSSTRGVHSHI